MLDKKTNVPEPFGTGRSVSRRLWGLPRRFPGAPASLEITPTEADGGPSATWSRGLSSRRRRVPVLAIAEDPGRAFDYTTRPHTWWGVISNGTAILGLGNLGELASKPGDGKARADAVQAALPTSIRSTSRSIPPTSTNSYKLRTPSSPLLRRHQPRAHQGA